MARKQVLPTKSIVSHVFFASKSSFTTRPPWFMETPLPGSSLSLIKFPTESMSSISLVLLSRSWWIELVFCLHSLISLAGHQFLSICDKNINHSLSDACSIFSGHHKSLRGTFASGYLYTWGLHAVGTFLVYVASFFCSCLVPWLVFSKRFHKLISCLPKLPYTLQHF